VTPFAASLGRGGQPAGEISQAALETHHNVGVDGRLPVGVTAWRLGAGLLRLGDAQRCIQQLVGVGCPRVLGDEQQDAPIRCLENSQETPRAVEIQPANDRELFSCQAYTRGRASAPAYVLDG
jgi:hypothetical protein